MGTTVRPPYSVAQYLTDLRAIRNTGSALPETSFYPPVDRLLNEAGRTLKPPVLATSQLRNTGAGQPDGGLFPQPKRSARNPHPPQPVHPERGVVEIKPAAHDLDTLAVGEQTRRYLQHYGLVLITNLRQFRLLEHNPTGAPHVREKYTLAESADDLWYAPVSQLAAIHIDLLPDFLRRVMLYKAPLTDPKDVAWFLASYAREARARAEVHDLPFFRNVKSALEESLGITFEGEKGDHFFRSTLVQTLFYGIFSAWVLWRRSNAAVHHAPSHPLATFNWRLADDFLHVPILRKLFREISDRRTLDSVQIAEILDLAGNVLTRVQPALFDVFRLEEAIAYFYEPFLEAFDPQLRKDLGVWYTPKEIVEYMVERVDHLLRSELAQPLGLASPNVRILDPCCGTGAYLTAVLGRIHRTLLQQAGDDPALVPHALRTAALTRVFGFEIMPAPFVIAHMEINRLLEEAGAPLSTGSGAAPAQRAGVFLTNALTGWIPETHPQSVLSEEFRREREDSEHIKQQGAILVILGNPPYNGYAGIAQIKEERNLTTAYRSPVAGLPAPQGQGLNDLYVRFFRIAERRIAANPDGEGIVSFISNYSWLDGLSHPTMRHHLLQNFSNIFVDNLHGDRKISEYAPDGNTSETVFAVAGKSVGIRIGTSISTLIRTGVTTSEAKLNYRDFHDARASNRRLSLLRSLKERNPSYTQLEPSRKLGLPFKPRIIGPNYLAWPRLPELFPISFPGIKTSRDQLLVDIDRDQLEARMKRYFDSRVSDETMARESPCALESAARFKAPEVRRAMQTKGFRQWQLLKYTYRPFDTRWLYWEPTTKLLDEKREHYIASTNTPICTIAAQQKTRNQSSAPQVTSQYGCLDLLDRGATCFPQSVVTASTLVSSATAHANISMGAKLVCERLGHAPAYLFFHALATMHTPQYRTENAGALLGDWPRIPLAATADLLAHSANLGRRLANLLDPESTPKLGPEYTFLARLDLPKPHNLTEHLKLTADWGKRGQGSTVMPGRGKLTRRAWTASETAKLATLAAPHAISTQQALALLGETCVDVHLNGDALWSAVPEHVWNYTLGGYQVLKKWLSYRELPLLNRPLRPEEAAWFSEVVRRISGILLLGPALDASYVAILPTAKGLTN